MLSFNKSVKCTLDKSKYTNTISGNHKIDQLYCINKSKNQNNGSLITPNTFENTCFTNIMSLTTLFQVCPGWRGLRSKFHSTKHRIWRTEHIRRSPGCSCRSCSPREASRGWCFGDILCCVLLNCVFVECRVGVTGKIA